MAEITKPKRVLNFQPKHKNMFLGVFKHFIPYFENPNIEDLQIHEFGKLTLKKRGGIKEFINDDNFSKYNLQTVMYICSAMKNQIFNEQNQQVSLMLPINYFRFTGCMGSSIKSGIDISIRLNDEQQLYSYKDFGLSLDEYDFIVTALKNKASMFIIGGTGAGKTSFSNLLVPHIGDNEIIKVVGDIHDYIFTENQKYNELFASNKEEYSEKFDLLMRVNPDRILISELTTSNVDLILRALNSGHKGFLLTMHSGSTDFGVAEAFKQNLAMVGNNVDVMEIHKSICGNVDMFIYLEQEGGKRFVDKIVINNAKMLQEAIQLEVFHYKAKMKSNVKSKPKQSSNNISKISKIIKMYKSGKSIRYLSKKFNIPKSTLSRYINQLTN